VKLSIRGIVASNSLTRSRVFGEQHEGVPQYLSLQLPHSGFSQTVSDLEAVWVKRSRRSHLGRDFRADRNQNRRYPLHFNFSLNRDDRPVANAWSTTGQDHNIGARAFINLVGNLASGTLVHRFQLHGIAHIADMLSRNTADETLRL